MILQFVILLLLQETLSTSGRLQKPLPNIIPVNQLVTVKLQKGESILFYVLDLVHDQHSLSVTLTPCSASVQWSIIYHNSPGIVNDTEILLNADSGSPDAYRGADMHTQCVQDARPGLYLIPVRALDGPTTVQIFVSRDPGGPHDLVHLQDPGLKLVPMRRRKLSVRWEPSVVNPHNTHYCLVVSSKKPYSKLCDAQETINAPRTISNHTDDDLTVACVKHKTHVVLHRLVKGRKYNAWLFATNVETRLTVPYGNASVILSPRVEPVVLLDGKPKTVSLRKHEGRVNFRFRVAQTGKDVHLYLVTCGGVVDAELMHRRQAVAPKRRVKDYARFKIPWPKKGDYYSLKVTAAGSDQLARIKTVEAFATQHASRFPMPALPPMPEVHEYVSLRRCSSVMIGWVPATDATDLYCVIVRRASTHAFREALLEEQCELDNRLRRSSFVSRSCSPIPLENAAAVTTHVVANLTANTSYSIQVTVQKHNGRTLSYKTLNVYTRHICD